MRHSGCVLFLAGAAAAVACGGSTQTTNPACDVGAEKCACTKGGACNPGLTCASSLCVRLSEGGTSGFDAAAAGDDGGGSGLQDGTAQDGATQDSTLSTEAGFGYGDGQAGDGGGWRSRVDPTCGSPTTLSGTVYDPAGKNPLANVWVYVPNDVSTLPAIPTGTRTCNTCDLPIGEYVTATMTDSRGKFTLSGVPAALQVPVTVQTGKWRRTTYVDVKNDCAPNSAADKSLHLPGTKAQGDMPQIALLTGGCDDMACFLVNMGIGASEFGSPHAGGRVDVYQGNGIGSGSGPTLDPAIGTAGACTTSTCPLWQSKASLEAYDVAVLSCECGAQTGTNETSAAYTYVHDWVQEGGRLLGSHYHYTWFQKSPDPQWVATATWLGTSVAAASGTYDVATTFPRGAGFGQWLIDLGVASSGPPPTVALSAVATSVSTVNPVTTQQWLYDPSSSDTKFLSFETPLRAADAGAATGSYCGKAAFTDMHSSSSLSATATNVPTDCTTADLTPQQKALEYLFFDLTGCISDDTKAYPSPPPSQ